MIKNPVDIELPKSLSARIRFKYMPQKLRWEDLVDLGIYDSRAEVYRAVIEGRSPDYYPQSTGNYLFSKSSVKDFLDKMIEEKRSKLEGRDPLEIKYWVE